MRKAEADRSPMSDGAWAGGRGTAVRPGIGISPGRPRPSVGRGWGPRGAAALLLLSLAMSCREEVAVRASPEPEEPAPTKAAPIYGGVPAGFRVWTGPIAEIRSDAALVMYGSASCGVSAALTKALEVYDFDGLPGLDRVYLPKEGLEERPPRFDGTPVLAFVQRGQVVDLQRGAVPLGSYRGFEENVRTISHLLARNGVLPDADRFVRKATWVDMRRSTDRVGLDLSGAEFAHAHLNGAWFSGCDLKAAHFEGADLENALFTHVDLTGARFEGARTIGVEILNSICPDGTPSRAHGEWCAAFGMRP